MTPSYYSPSPYPTHGYLFTHSLLHHITHPLDNTHPLNTHSLIHHIIPSLNYTHPININRSRIRKRVILDLLQDQLAGLRGENVKLRRIVVERMPDKAGKILEDCTTEDSHLLSEQGLGEGEEGLDGLYGREAAAGASSASSGGAFQGQQLPITTVRLKPHPDELHATNALFGGNSGTCRYRSCLIRMPYYLH